jgi:hypothetical protein
MAEHCNTTLFAGAGNRDDGTAGLRRNARTGRRVVGIDLSPRSVDEARAWLLAQPEA